MTYFVKVYKAKYGSNPKDINGYRDKWGFSELLDQFGPDRGKEIIDYYLTSRRPGHPTSYLIYNYEKLNNVMEDREKDAARRKAIMAESKTRVEEWRGK